MWMQERFSYEGRYFSMPSRAVLPKHTRNPTADVGGSHQPGTELDGRRRGIGSLESPSRSFAEQEAKVKEYRRRIQNCNPLVACQQPSEHVNFLYCTKKVKLDEDRYAHDSVF
jgi:hypothetical protein